MTPSVSIITFTHGFRDMRSEVFKVIKILIVKKKRVNQSHYRPGVTQSVAGS